MSQRGGGFKSLYGLNQPSFYDTSCPSYYNNQYGFSEGLLRPFGSGNNSVGNGAANSYANGQAFYSLPMSGAGKRRSRFRASVHNDDSSETSDAEVDWDLASEATSDTWHEQSAGGNGDDENEDEGESTVDDAWSQAGGSPAPMPWQYYNPTVPMCTQALNYNNPLIPKVGPSGNSPTFDSSNMIGGHRRRARSRSSRRSRSRSLSRSSCGSRSRSRSRSRSH